MSGQKGMTNGNHYKQEPKTILVTGGAGYIGSHTCLQLLEQGYKVVILDNLSNSSYEAVKRVGELSGQHGRLQFIQADLVDVAQTESAFMQNRYDAVIHFAGLKAVGESVQVPLKYYQNNLTGTINLLDAMARHGCKHLVFSSSATVYGSPKIVPCTESSPLGGINPYGRTKLYIEEICRDVCVSDPHWKVILLRYFNPVGAHPSGRIGEDPRGIPNNLMPFVQQVAVGRRRELSVFGTDYPTHDGTCIRDYIHVMDLADGHVDALRRLFNTAETGCEVYNLGTGKGTSVLEMVEAFENACGKSIAKVMTGRRVGDSAVVYADPKKAEAELGWRAKYDINQICKDQWNWAQQNPWGYDAHDGSEEAVSTPPKSPSKSSSKVMDDFIRKNVSDDRYEATT